MKPFTIMLVAATVVAGPGAAQEAGPAAAALGKPGAPASSTAEIAKLVQSSCTSCHVATQYSARKKTAAQWGETVDQMIGFGAVISDDQYDKIVAYLAATYGVDAKP